MLQIKAVVINIPREELNLPNTNMKEFFLMIMDNNKYDKAAKLLCDDKLPFLFKDANQTYQYYIKTLIKIIQFQRLPINHIIALILNIINRLIHDILYLTLFCIPHIARRNDFDINNIDIYKIIKNFSNMCISKITTMLIPIFTYIYDHKYNPQDDLFGKCELFNQIITSDKNFHLPFSDNVDPYIINLIIKDIGIYELIFSICNELSPNNESNIRKLLNNYGNEPKPILIEEIQPKNQYQKTKYVEYIPHYHNAYIKEYFYYYHEQYRNATPTTHYNIFVRIKEAIHIYNVNLLIRKQTKKNK